MCTLTIPVVHLTLFLKLEHVTVLFVVHPQLGRRTLFHWEVKFSNVVLCVTRELVRLTHSTDLRTDHSGALQLDALPREKSSPTLAYNIPQIAPTARSPVPASAAARSSGFNQLQSVADNHQTQQLVLA